MVECRSSPSPERNRCTLSVAALWAPSTSLIALLRTSRNEPPPAVDGETDSTVGGVIAGRLEMLSDIALTEQLQGFLDHVLDRGDRRDIGRVIPRGTQQVDHVLGRIHARVCDVAVFIR